MRKELQLGCYFGSEHVKLGKAPVSESDLSPCRRSVLPRIIPFQRPLKIKELLQKVTEAFGQQMDMFFMEKEVQMQKGEAVSDVNGRAKKQLSVSQCYCGKRSRVARFLVPSAVAAPEDSGGLGSSRHDVGQQLRGQWAAQDIAQDSQKQPCEC